MDRTWDRLTKTLEDLDFPAGKEEIVAHAGRRGADPETLRLVRALPLATYRNISELRSSVPLDPAADEEVDAAGRAGRAR